MSVQSFSKIWPFAPLRQLYEPVESEEKATAGYVGVEEKAEAPLLSWSKVDDMRDEDMPTGTELVRRNHILLGVTVLVLFVLGLGAVLYTALRHGGHTTSDSTSTLTPITPPPPALDPSLDASSLPLRREWRTLTSSEQHTYITAAHCLLDHPSRFPLHNTQAYNSTLYADFPYVHAHAGYSTHNSAAFLPWHRGFLSIYHTALREECGYEGELVYWDWTLDSDDLAHAPVFHVEPGKENEGFGGDGEVGGPIVMSKTGRCVRTGAFQDVVAEYNDVIRMPHCLSRGFVDDTGSLGHIDGDGVSPASMSTVLALKRYEEFVAKMESVVHDTIPFGIGGDFWTFTAPYDPLFYLHHVQLDRLWWIWQQQGEGRIWEYEGHKGRHSIEMAALDDRLEYMGLAPNLKVKDVMNTSGDGEGMLRYRY